MLTRLTITLTLLSALCVTNTAFSDTKKEIVGAWSSVGCELRPQQNADGSIGEWWLTREITFETNRIEAQFTTYAEAGCITPVNALHFAGTAELIRPSSLLKGAYEAKLTIDEFVRITPLADDFTGFLNSAGTGACGSDEWKTGDAQNVLTTGCTVLGLKPDDPTIEYEILSVIDNMLYFAARPVDGSFMTTPDKRINALQIGLRRL